MSTAHGSLSPQSFKRLQGGQLILKGLDNEEVAELVDASLSSVKNWRRKLQAHNNDLACLVREKGTGRQNAKLTAEQKQQVKEIVLAGAKAAGFPDERWTTKLVAQLVRQTFNMEFSRSSARRLLLALGFSPQMPIVKSHKYSDKEVLDWAQRTWTRLKKSEKTRYSLSFDR